MQNWTALRSGAKKKKIASTEIQITVPMYPFFFHFSKKCCQDLDPEVLTARVSVLMTVDHITTQNNP